MGIVLVQTPRYDAKCDCCGNSYGAFCAVSDLQDNLMIDGWSYNYGSGKVLCDDCSEEEDEANSYEDDTYL